MQITSPPETNTKPSHSGQKFTCWKNRHSTETDLQDTIYTDTSYLTYFCLIFHLDSKLLSINLFARKHDYVVTEQFCWKKDYLERDTVVNRRYLKVNEKNTQADNTW